MAYLLHQLLSRSADRHPDNIAASYEGQSLSYSDLDKLTNKVALQLKTAGLRPGDRAGIYVNKSLASIISLFAILKAGGVSVPLDPKAPPSRLAYICKNCDLRILLTVQNKIQGLPEFLESGAPLETILFIDNDGDPGQKVSERSRDDLEGGLEVIPWAACMAQDPAAWSPPRLNETDLAYILYTSGSTGRPKGVMISHRNILTFVDWCTKKFAFRSEDRFSSHAPLHFDLSTLDIYAAIKSGATVVLIPESASIFPYQLAKILAEERISVTYLVPSILSLLVNYGKLEDHDFKHMRLVLFAGEVFPIKYLRRLVENLPGPDYYNLYGPTETNVCTYYKVRPADLASAETRPVPIGQACENMEVFAVAEDGVLITEPGQEGELWVRGSCVALGYWGDPQQTAQRFVKNPYQPDFNETVYRTGDLVSLDPDGKNWHFLGRKDNMIKSRGYRIELGEVESVLYSHPGVRQAAVIAVPDELIGNRLKAFVAGAQGFTLDSGTLLDFCKGMLPAYMVPESFQFLSELPKTSTGKVDRQILGSLEKKQQDSD